MHRSQSLKPQAGVLVPKAAKESDPNNAVGIRRANVLLSMVDLQPHADTLSSPARPQS
jgi:hypothetical protein